MKTILTDSEIEEQFFAAANTNARGFARAIEQAILAKIGEAVAARSITYSGEKYLAWWHKHFSAKGYEHWEPLYAIPFIEGDE